MGAEQNIKILGFWFERQPGKYWMLSRKTSSGWLIIASSN